MALAENTGFFKADEIYILKEVVLDYQKSPNEDYYLLEEWEGEIFAGFIPNFYTDGDGLQTYYKAICRK